MTIAHRAREGYLPLERIALRGLVGAIGRAIMPVLSVVSSPDIRRASA